MSSHKILVFSREKKERFEEKVYGGKYVEFFYSHPFGKILEFVISLPFISKLYGMTQNWKISKRKIDPFIEKFEIPMNEYEDKEFQSFNEFFIRNFKPGMRKFDSRQEVMPSFCEARYFGYEKIDDGVKFPVKGKFLSTKALIGESDYSKYFEGGPLLIARLCPVDYHCYHYPLDGKTLDVSLEGEKLHSVNPLALKSVEDLFLKNKRRVSILETKEFGKLAYIEVGATCVGKIIQTHDEAKAFTRGDKKGHFLFGGSTVILIGEKGKWTPSLDIIEHTKKGSEVYLKLGDEVARSLN